MSTLVVILLAFFGPPLLSGCVLAVVVRSLYLALRDAWLLP